MRRRFVSVLMIPLLLLAGCGAREAGAEKRFEAFREAAVRAQSITATAALTADYGGTAQEYVLALESDGTEVAVEVVEPELIAGVRATARWGETTLSYDGVMLAAGPLDEEGITPVSALPAVLRAMTSGYEELVWREGDLIAARLYVGEDSVCTVWIGESDLTPTAAEIASGGRTVVACRFTDWTMISG